MRVVVFIDALSETRHRLAGELRAIAASARGREMRGVLLSSADQLDRPTEMVGVERQVFVVKGEEISDGSGSSWIVCAFRSEKAANGLISDLTKVAVAFGESIGKVELAGLEHGQRRELESHLKKMDRNVKVGRHGVRWVATTSTMRNE